MIGGFDRQIVIERPSAEVLDTAARAILRRWKRAVFQSGDATVFGTLGEVPFAKVTELFVYRDQASREDWELHGATQQNATAMIHLLANKTGITVVVGDLSEAVAAGLLGELEQLRYVGQRPRRAA